MSKRRKANGRGAGVISITLAVAIFLTVMGFQIIQLRQKDEALAARQADKEEEYAQETERAEKLDELERYMQTDQYIEDTAKSKLGLAYENEIIFKESKE